MNGVQDRWRFRVHSLTRLPIGSYVVQFRQTQPQIIQLGYKLQSLFLNNPSRLHFQEISRVQVGKDEEALLEIFAFGGLQKQDFCMKKDPMILFFEPQ